MKRRLRRMPKGCGGCAGLRVAAAYNVEAAETVEAVIILDAFSCSNIPPISIPISSTTNIYNQANPNVKKIFSLQAKICFGENVNMK